MKKELKDYLHLYLGCECEIDSNGTVGKLIAMHLDAQTCRILQPPYSAMNGGWVAKLSEIKPILRRLDSMTEEDWSDLNTVQTISQGNHFLSIDAERTKLLLSKGFDLFGLCDAGLAIDSATLETQKP